MLLRPATYILNLSSAFSIKVMFSINFDYFRITSILNMQIKNISYHIDYTKYNTINKLHCCKTLVITASTNLSHQSVIESYS